MNQTVEHPIATPDLPLSPGSPDDRYSTEEMRQRSIMWDIYMIKIPQPGNKVAGLAEQLPAAVFRAGRLHDQFRRQQLLQNLVEPA